MTVQHGLSTLAMATRLLADVPLDEILADLERAKAEPATSAEDLVRLELAWRMARSAREFHAEARTLAAELGWPSAIDNRFPTSAPPDGDDDKTSG